MNKHPQALHTAVAAAVLATAGVTSFNAAAASGHTLSAAERAQVQQTYRAERAACLDGSSTQERGACLAEAAAARQEALRGELGLQTVARNERLAPAEDDHIANALSRCDAVPADVRGDCERRVLGDDVIVTGSVAEGVIIRELPAAEAGQAVVVAMADNGQEVIQAEPVEPPMEAPPTPPASEALALQMPTATRGITADAGPATVAPEASLAASESLAEPAPEAVTAPVTEAVAESVIEPVIEPVTEPVTEPVNDPVTEPVTEPAPEGQTEIPAELQAEPQATLPAAPADDMATSSLEPSPYPAWMQAQRFE